MGFQISTRQSGDVTILDLKGKATIGVDCDLLRSHLKELVAHGARKLLLNMADVTQVDSSGLGVLVGTDAPPVRSWLVCAGRGGAVGLYSVAGFNGLPTGLDCFFFGFLFSRPRLSRLPMPCSPL